MWSSTNKIAAGVAGVVLLSSQIYGDWSSRTASDARVRELESQLQSVRDADAARISELAMELDLVQNRVGVTATGMEAARKSGNAARQEQAIALAALRKSIDEHGRSIDSYRRESGAKIEEVRTEATSQIGAINGQVGAINGQVGNVRSDLDATKTDLASSRREIGDVRDQLGRQIARNAEDLATLRLLGERDYFEFDIRKAKDMERIAGIRLQLNKADIKARKYDITVQVDDNKLQKKGQLINEPVQFLVGRDRLRFEVVVNLVDKDRIRGYVSTPKNAVVRGDLARQD